LLLPNVVKLEHHHDRSCSHEENTKGQSIGENCYICDFQYSVFIPAEVHDNCLISYFSDHFINHYKSSFFSDNLNFSFLLRAPPLIQSV